ncbi:hypothetical protein OROMI_004341 [Orobanche minor]
MMMGFCSAILHRGIFGSGATGVFRSNRILICNSFSLAANRMISSESGVEFPAPAPAPVPWLMFKPTFNGHGPGDSLFRFYNLAENRIYNFFTFNYEEKLTGRYYWRFLGTSNGWLGVYDAENHDLWLVDPMMDLLTRLPPVVSVVHRLLVLDKGRLAIVAQGSLCNLAFCSLDASSWTSFASERRAYDSFTYSSRDSRLVCIARECECDVGYNKTNLEIWNLEGRTPELEWEMHFDLDSTSYRPDSRKLKYIVCDEQSGELFVVVRNVRIRHGIGGSFVDGIIDTEYKGTECYKPFRTTGFKVYRVDRERRRLILMKDSLQGLAMFVGTNQPIAIPAAGLAGVKPDSVYFTYDSRIKKPRSSFSFNKDLLHDPMHDCSDYRFSGYDFGIFDYMGKNFSHVCKCNPDSDYVHNPMWFI